MFTLCLKSKARVLKCFQYKFHVFLSHLEAGPSSQTYSMIRKIQGGIIPLTPIQLFLVLVLSLGIHFT